MDESRQFQHPRITSHPEHATINQLDGDVYRLVSTSPDNESSGTGAKSEDGTSLAQAVSTSPDNESSGTGRFGDHHLLDWERFQLLRITSHPEPGKMGGR